MILYIEKDILLDTQCRDLYLCDNGLNDEYLIISSIDQCCCKTKHIILCKYDHDICSKRCLLENNLLIKQKNQTNEIFINNYPVNIVLLDKNELKNNSEIVYICQGNNLPKPILEHLKNQFTFTDNLSMLSFQTSIGDFLLKHSFLVQSIYGMYLIFQQARHNSYKLR
jgi:hypothetical protein